MIFLAERKIVLLEIFSMALNSLFFPGEGKKNYSRTGFCVSIEPCMNFIRERNLESHRAFILFRGMLSELSPDSVEERGLSERDKKVEMFWGLCDECNIISAQEIGRLEKSES